MSQPATTTQRRPGFQRRLEKVFLTGAILVAALTTIPRLLPGLPGGVDSSSHLYKVIFIHDSLRTNGSIPFWSPDWYAGTPSLLLYPPVSYLAAAVLGLSGLGPVVGYKLLEFLAYVTAPVGIYFLAKEFRFEDYESGLAALFFVLVPQIIENFLFFDRFPNVVAIPIFCLFVISFLRLLTYERKSIYAGASALLLGALILTHQLTAMIAFVTTIVLIVTRVVLSSKSAQLLPWSLGSMFLGVAVASAWLFPLVGTARAFANNPFFNRNVEVDVFIQFSYFGFDVASYLLGIAQFVLAALGTQSIVGRMFGKTAKFQPKVFFPILLIGMIVYEYGHALNIARLVGQILVVVAFLVLISQLGFRGRQLNSGAGFWELGLIVWFFVLLWLGLGSYALPIVQLPILKDLWVRLVDVYRFWLFLSIPMVVLAARGARRTFEKVSRKNVMLVIVVFVLVALPIGYSVGYRVQYSLTGPIRKDVLEYTAANADIPREVLEYFRNDIWDGRILGIRAPLWIYLLPAIVGKPIVDGWFPQSKLVKPLVAIDDYRLNDLETKTLEERIGIWKFLVQSSDLLAINWLLLGEVDDSVRHLLVDGTGFQPNLTLTYQGKPLHIYRSGERHQMISVLPSEAGNANYKRTNPDLIEVDVSELKRPATILVKEAYFSTWRAESAGTLLRVGEDAETGMILFNVPAGAKRITLFQKAEWPAGQYATILALVVVAGLMASPKFSCFNLRGRGTNE